MAYAYYFLSSTYVNPAEVIPRARAAAKRAIKLDPNLSEAHASLAVVAYLERDWTTVERESQEAIRLDPNDARAHFAFAGYLLVQGQLEKAQEEYDRGRDLDPLSNANPAIWCIYLRGRYDEAIVRLNDMARLAPNDPQTWYNLGQCYAQKGQYVQAIAALRKAVAVADAPWHLGMLGHAYGLAGQRDSAQAVITRMRASGRIPPYCFALVYAGLGDRDRCFEWLEKAYNEADDNVNNLKVDLAFRSMRNDPRYASLVRRLGLDA